MSKKADYFHDRPILTFSVVNIFLVLATTVTIIIRVASGPNTGFISRYRENLGLDAFSSGSTGDILAFIGFVLMVFIFGFVISRKIYDMNRYAALMVVSATMLTLLFALIVSNSLLSLR